MTYCHIHLQRIDKDEITVKYAASSSDFNEAFKNVSIRDMEMEFGQCVSTVGLIRIVQYGHYLR